MVDYVITIDPERLAVSARIVIEAKESGSHELKRTLEDADMVRVNRQAECASSSTRPHGASELPDLTALRTDIVREEGRRRMVILEQIRKALKGFEGTNTPANSEEALPKGL